MKFLFKGQWVKPFSKSFGFSNKSKSNCDFAIGGDESGDSNTAKIRNNRKKGQLILASLLNRTKAKFVVAKYKLRRSRSENCELYSVDKNGNPDFRSNKKFNNGDNKLKGFPPDKEGSVLEKTKNFSSRYGRRLSGGARQWRSMYSRTGRKRMSVSNHECGRYRKSGGIDNEDPSFVVVQVVEDDDEGQDKGTQDEDTSTEECRKKRKIFILNVKKNIKDDTKIEPSEDATPREAKENDNQLTKQDSNHEEFDKQDSCDIPYTRMDSKDSILDEQNLASDNNNDNENVIKSDDNANFDNENGEDNLISIKDNQMVSLNKSIEDLFDTDFDLDILSGSFDSVNNFLSPDEDEDDIETPFSLTRSKSLPHSHQRRYRRSIEYPDSSDIDLCPVIELDSSSIIEKNRDSGEIDIKNISIDKNSLVKASNSLKLESLSLNPSIENLAIFKTISELNLNHTGTKLIKMASLEGSITSLYYGGELNSSSELDFLFDINSNSNFRRRSIICSSEASTSADGTPANDVLELPIDASLMDDSSTKILLKSDHRKNSYEIELHLSDQQTGNSNITEVIGLPNVATDAISWSNDDECVSDNNRDTEEINDKLEDEDPEIKIDEDESDTVTDTTTGKNQDDPNLDIDNLNTEQTDSKKPININIDIIHEKLIECTDKLNEIHDHLAKYDPNSTTLQDASELSSETGCTSLDEMIQEEQNEPEINQEEIDQDPTPIPTTSTTTDVEEIENNQSEDQPHEIFKEIEDSSESFASKKENFENQVHPKFQKVNSEKLLESLLELNVKNLLEKLLEISSENNRSRKSSKSYCIDSNETKNQNVEAASSQNLNSYVENLIELYEKRLQDLHVSNIDEDALKEQVIEHLDSDKPSFQLENEKETSDDKNDEKSSSNDNFGHFESNKSIEKTDDEIIESPETEECKELTPRDEINENEKSDLEKTENENGNEIDIKGDTDVILNTEEQIENKCVKYIPNENIPDK